MARTKLAVHPKILTWARERRGFNLSTAANRLDLSPERLADLEAGLDMPTAAKVRAAARLYHVSPGVFFLSEVPDKGFTPPADFRTVGSQESAQFSPELREEIERVRSQQAFLKELAELGSIQPVRVDVPEVGTDDAEMLAKRLRAWLKIDEFLKAPMKKSEFLGAWIAAIEEKGIFVSQVSGIPVAEMRGFCLPDAYFPMIVLNGADSNAGRLFTLLHELIHVLQGEQCICNNPLTLGASESRCNAVAAAMLMPRHLILQRPEVKAAPASKAWTIPELDEIASEFGVSSEAVLRRLLTLGKTSEAHYRETRKRLSAMWQRKPDPRGGGPPHDVLLLRNLGNAYVHHVISARNKGVLTDSEVSTYIFAKVRWAEAMAARLDLPYV